MDVLAYNLGPIVWKGPQCGRDKTGLLAVIALVGPAERLIE